MQRYNHNIGGIFEDKDGALVLYKDYASEVAKREVREANLILLIEQCKNELDALRAFTRDIINTHGTLHSVRMLAIEHGLDEEST